MKKKHQPGCPCCVMPNPCGCDVTQLRMDLVSNETFSFPCGPAPIGGPCPYIEFTFDMTGTYYITPTSEETTTSLLFYNTDGVQECDTGRYCAVLAVNITTMECFVKYELTLYLFWDPLKTETVCPTLEDYGDWTLSTVGTESISYVNWCGSIDDDLSWSAGDGECPGTPLEVNIEIYPA